MTARKPWLKGDFKTRTAVQRWCERVALPSEPGGCWTWTGYIGKNRYGHIRIQGKMVKAHRFGYERFVGPIPEGLHIDHIVCDNPACVNPMHVKPVTKWENTRRGRSPHARHARQTHCVHGHVFAGDNVKIIVERRGPRRRCVTCERGRWQAKKRVA